MMDTFETIIGSEIIAIARGICGEQLIKASCALYEAGVRAFEVTFEQDTDPVRMYENIVRTSDNIVRLYENLPKDAVIGAGTVLTVDQVCAAHSAGARFIISPNTDRTVIEKTKELGMLSIPGAMTPTEIVNAYSFGADIVKLFPAGDLGAGYFKSVRAPLKHIPLAAVAGITAQNIGSFKKAGAVAYGISSSLYKTDAINKGDYESVRLAAEAFYKALRE